MNEIDGVFDASIPFNSISLQIDKSTLDRLSMSWRSLIDAGIPVSTCATLNAASAFDGNLNRRATKVPPAAAAITDTIGTTIATTLESPLLELLRALDPPVFSLPLVGIIGGGVGGGGHGGWSCGVGGGDGCGNRGVGTGGGEGGTEGGNGDSALVTVGPDSAVKLARPLLAKRVVMSAVDETLPLNVAIAESATASDATASVATRFTEAAVTSSVLPAGAAPSDASTPAAAASVLSTVVLTASV